MITIALLCCSISSFANNNNIPSTGEVVNRDDSVLIAYDDIRIVNSKLIELEYEKQINENLRTIVSNDSTLIDRYATINKNLNEDCKRAIHQRNVCFGVGVVAILTSILLLVK